MSWIPESLPEVPAIVVTNVHPRWRLDREQLRALILNVLTAEGRSYDYVGVRLTTAAEVRALNKRWRDANYETDVLSFPLGEGRAVDGEIVVSFDFAAEHCAAYDNSLSREVSRYVVHGLLHLMGYDDATEAGRQEMKRREDALLESGELPQALDHSTDRT